MMRGTKAFKRHSGAITTRGKRSGRAHPRLRAPGAAIFLGLLAALSPDLMLAPTSAIEPGRTEPPRIASVDLPPRPIRVQQLDFADPTDAQTTIAPAVPPAPRVDVARFEAALEAARQFGSAYGVTFAAVRDGQVLWTGSAGMHRDEVTPLRAEDPLVIGSVTKTFVAATVLQLADEGRIRLDDTLRAYLPGMSSVSRKITIRQLLDHTSGLADVFNDATRRGLEEDPDRAWTAAEVLKTLHAPWYEPGQGWAYANTNYFLLGLVIERVTGASLADELDARFLDPLDLEQTRLLTGAEDEGGQLPPAWSTIFWASGAMAASAADLARWGDALYGDAILSDASRADMLALNSHDYGLGLQRVQVPGARGYGHTGLLRTFTTLLVHLPEDNVTLALLVNRSDVDLGGMLAARPPNGPSLLELLGIERPKAPAAPAPSSSAAP